MFLSGRLGWAIVLVLVAPVAAEPAPPSLEGMLADVQTTASYELRSALLELRDDTRELRGEATPPSYHPAAADANPWQVPTESLANQIADLQAALPTDSLQSAIAMAQKTAQQAGSLSETFLGTTPNHGRHEAKPQTEATTAPFLTPAIVIAAGAAAATAAAIAFWLVGSSGAVGSPAAAAARRVADLRRLLPFASPLFTRFERDTVLGHPRREALYALILQEPGISLQTLGDATGLSRTAVIHHLRLLEQQHLIVSRRVGRSRHYFENGGRYGHDQKEAYALLQNDRSKAVADYVRSHPGALQKQVCEALGIQPSIAHWHVRRLQEAGVIESVRQGRCVAYFPGRSLPTSPPPAANAVS